MKKSETYWQNTWRWTQAKSNWSMPVKKIKDDKRISLAHPINAEFRAEMEKAILDAYYASLEEKEEDDPFDDIFKIFNR